MGGGGRQINGNRNRHIYDIVFFTPYDKYARGSSALARGAKIRLCKLIYTNVFC